MDSGLNLSFVFMCSWFSCTFERSCDSELLRLPLLLLWGVGRRGGLLAGAVWLWSSPLFLCGPSLFFISVSLQGVSLSFKGAHVSEFWELVRWTLLLVLQPPWAPLHSLVTGRCRTLYFSCPINAVPLDSPPSSRGYFEGSPVLVVRRDAQLSSAPLHCGITGVLSPCVFWCLWGLCNLQSSPHGYLIYKHKTHGS